MARDRRNDVKLFDMGWTPIHFWEKEVKKDVDGCAADIVSLIIEQLTEELPVTEE